MDYQTIKVHMETKMGYHNVSVAPQNMNKNSKPTRLLKSKGLPSETLVWTWNFRKDGSIHWIGAFVKNWALDKGLLTSNEVFRTKPHWEVRGEEYTFFSLA